MPVKYINRKGHTYYLHQAKTRTGNPKYFFSMRKEGLLVDKIPDDYEIYENPNAQVFLRRAQPKIITDEEILVVKKGIDSYCDLKYYQIDVKKETIIVFVADQDVETLSKLLDTGYTKNRQKVQDVLSKSITYSPILRFILIDEEKRKFIVQRYCFLGSIDDWIDIGEPDSLESLAKKYMKHLGQESFYELL